MERFGIFHLLNLAAPNAPAEPENPPPLPTETAENEEPSIDAESENPYWDFYLKQVALSEKISGRK